MPVAGDSNIHTVKHFSVWAYLPVLLFLLGNSFCADAQWFNKERELKTGNNPVIRIPLTDRVEDDKISKSLAIAPVYKYTSDSIQPYQMFGVEDKPDLDPLLIRKMPNMEGMVDTGYTYLYFSGANTEYNQGYLVTLIGNYRKSQRTIYFFVDRNNNLDFTDDGPPVELDYYDFSVIITLNNLKIPESSYQIKLTRIQDESYKYKVLLTQHFKTHSGKREFTHINYCYREQRLNTLAGNYISDTDSFQIALKDYNVNGVFNESCTDRFYVGKIGEKVYTDEMIDLVPDITLTTFEWNGKLYRIRAVESSGKYVEIQQVEGIPLRKKLEVGKKVPKFEFTNVSNETEKLRDYRRKPVYLFFYDFETITDEDTTYLGKIYREFSDQISVITLNHGDQPRLVYSRQYYNSIHWPMGFSSYSIGRMYYLENLTKGFYIGKRLKLRKDDVSPKQMYEMLKK